MIPPKKVCVLGAFGVGKTSLVSRCVHTMLSEKYVITVGVQIGGMSMSIDGAAWSW
jgi:GTPase SAR1 family protein